MQEYTPPPTEQFTRFANNDELDLHAAQTGIDSYPVGHERAQVAQEAEYAKAQETRIFTLPEQVGQTSLRLVELRRLAKEDYAQAA